MIRALLLFSIAVLSFELPASDSDCSNCTIYKGYIRGDMEMWKKGMSELQEAYRRTSEPCLLFTLTEARYGYIGFLLGTDKKDEAKLLVDTFEKDIEQLAALPEYKAETEAFRLALLGYRMGLNPARAMTLGPKAVKQLEKAFAIGPGSPEVWIEKANSEAHMPAFAGGSKVKSAESFREALRLFEADPSLSECNWRYLNAMVLLGQTLEQTGDYKGAREAYLRALRKEPGFQWVRDELLPAVEKKIK